MRKTNVILLSTLNKGKIAEYREIFKEFQDLQLKPISEAVFNADMLAKVETGKTYYENAFNKCRHGHYAAKYPTISDDTGLEVDALGKRPGVDTEKYPGVMKLLEELKGVPKDKRTASFVCTIVFMVEGVELVATEKVDGVILESPSGNQGFGYDPIFMPIGAEKSFGKMTMEEKNALSHRAKAFRTLMRMIKEKNIQLVHP